MKVKIAKWGNSLGVRLPKAVTEGLSPGQIAEVSRKGSRVEIETKVSDPDHVPIPRYRLEDLVAEMKRLGPENEPAFEDWGILPSEWPLYEAPDGEEDEGDGPRGG